MTRLPTLNKQRLQEDFRFPILDFKEVIECIGLMDVKVSSSQLRSPTQEMVHQIFTAAIQTLYDVDMNQYTQKMMDLCSSHHQRGNDSPNSTDENPSGELTLFPHHDAKILHQFMSPMVFFERCREMMHAAQYDYFSMMDLVKPNAERLLVQLSAIINLLRYKSGEEQQLEEYHSQQVALEGELETVSHSHAQTKDELEMFRDQDEMERPQREALQNELVEMQNEITHQDQQQKLLKESVQKMKAEIEQLNISNDNITGYISTLKQEVERLQAGVVKDPETMRREIDTLSSHQERMKVDLHETIHKKQELDKRFETFSHLKTDLDKCIQSLNDVKELREKSQALTKEYNQKKHQLDKLADELEELRGQHTHLERIVDNLHNASKRKQQKHHHKEKFMLTQISDMQNRKLRIQKDLGEVKSQIEDIENQEQLLQHSCEELKEQHERDMKEMQSQFHKLTETVETYRANFKISQLR